MYYDTNRVGERSIPRRHEIDKGSIRRFAEALGDDNPIYLDEQIARAQGFLGIPAPPTFAVTLRRNPVPGLNLPSAGVIHGEQEFIYGRPMCVGDWITVVAWLDQVKLRPGRRGQMTLLTVNTEGQHDSGEMGFQSWSVLIITEGAD